MTNRVKTQDKTVQKALFAFTMLICLALMLLSNAASNQHNYKTSVTQTEGLTESIRQPSPTDGPSRRATNTLSTPAFAPAERGYGASYVSIEGLRP